MPDFSTLPADVVRTISEEELKQAGHRRFIVVGDIHGMHASYQFVKFLLTLIGRTANQHLHPSTGR